MPSLHLESAATTHVSGSFLEAGAGPRLQLPLPVPRADAIDWEGGVGGAPLTVRLGFDNPSPLPSAPARARVEVAGFGAFVPTMPLIAFTVPSVPPHRRRVMTATVSAGSPPRWSTAPPSPTPELMLSAFRRVTRTRGEEEDRTSADFLWLRETVHMVGNLNVFVTRSRPVERHVQRAIGLRPGACNVSMFCVGDGRPDEYTFSVGECEPGWDMSLVERDWDRPLRIASGSILLTIRTAPRAESGRASVLVHRRSTRQTVPVEFELEMCPPGARCYTF